MKNTVSTIGSEIKEKFGLKFFPLGMYYTDQRPEQAMGFKSKGNGCIMPLIFAGAKGNTVAFDKDTTGWDCSAFYLGYKDWIFNGVESFLSDGSILGRAGERFVRTKEQAKDLITSLKPKVINDKVTVFKPLEMFEEGIIPETVIFFANADQLSGLVSILYYNSPGLDDRIITRFMSGCGSVVTLPMKYKREGNPKAIWGMHDIAARHRIPADLMTLTMPWEMAVEIHGYLGSSFVITDTWKKIKERNEP